MLAMAVVSAVAGFLGAGFLGAIEIPAIDIAASAIGPGDQVGELRMRVGGGGGGGLGISDRIDGRGGAAEEARLERFEQRLCV